MKEFGKTRKEMYGDIGPIEVAAQTTPPDENEVIYPCVYLDDVDDLGIKVGDEVTLNAKVKEFKTSEREDKDGKKSCTSYVLEVIGADGVSEKASDGKKAEKPSFMRKSSVKDDEKSIDEGLDASESEDRQRRMTDENDEKIKSEEKK